LIIKCLDYTFAEGAFPEHGSLTPTFFLNELEFATPLQSFPSPPTVLLYPPAFCSQTFFPVFRYPWQEVSSTKMLSISTGRYLVISQGILLFSDLFLLRSPRELLSAPTRLFFLPFPPTATQVIFSQGHIVPLRD